MCSTIQMIHTHIPTWGKLTDVCHAANHQATHSAWMPGERGKRQSAREPKTNGKIVHHPYRSGSINQSDAGCGSTGTLEYAATA